jgi:hypothetical protein
MPQRRISAPTPLTPEERAFFLQLAAFNAAFDAARTGEPARVMAARADAIDELLNRYFLALTAQDPSQPQVL